MRHQAFKLGEMEEILIFQHDPFAAPAYAGIPLTYRGCASSAAIVTGHDVGKVNWRELLSAVDTIVILMGSKNLPEIMSRLIEVGCDPHKPVSLIQSGTNISQDKLDGTVATIASLARPARFCGATVIVVGEVVRLGKELEWFQKTKRPPAAGLGKDDPLGKNTCGNRSSVRSCQLPNKWSPE